MGKASRKKQLQRQNKPYSDVKVSQALLDICDSFLPKGDLAREDDLGKLLGISATAWNIANSPEELQNALLKKFIESLPYINAEIAKIEKFRDIPKDEISILNVLSAMVSLKQKRYPNDKRFIIDYTINENNVQVASIEPNEQPATVQVAM